MELIWKYKIDVEDANVFEKIGEKRGIIFPEDLKKFILECNAATPSKYCFMVGNNERVFGAVLSFNLNETEAESVFDVLPIIVDKNLIPFGVDPFGNYICYAVREKEIVFWDHETDKVISTGKILKDFIKELY